MEKVAEHSITASFLKQISNVFNGIMFIHFGKMLVKKLNILKYINVA